jgi:hypothetical protein
MLPPRKTRELARSLVACETDSDSASRQTEPASVRVYEKLRRQLGTSVGADGFQAIASRALALARSESPRFDSVRVAENGSLRGLDEAESQTRTDEDSGVGIILIAQILGLFLIFLGEATTLNLIEDLRLQVDVETTPAMAMPAADMVSSAAQISALAAAFEDLLLEIDRLRSVSERIETLADKHPGMEDGLVSVAGNIRSIATVLDVFALIKSNAGGPQEEAPSPQPNFYMN